MPCARPVLRAVSAKEHGESAMEKQIILSARLQTVADLIPRGCRVADIGTDHAYLPIWLVQNKIASFAAACDVNRGPLEHARRSAAQYGVEAQLSFRLGDGLACIAPGEVDTIVIAGMGGETMISILEAAPWTNAPEFHLLLQPQTKAELLRPWLAAHGYRFQVERLVYENHTYFPIMSMRGGGEACALTEGQCRGGVALAHDPLQGAALEKTIRQLSRAAEGLERSQTPENAEKAVKNRALIAQLQKMKEEWLCANGKGN